MKDINQYRYITHKNQNTMIRVIIENPKTGKSYICKSYSETTKDITYYHITYSCILRHKDHPFFKQFYHGPNGMQTGSERYKEIQELEKAVIGAPLYKLLGLTITETPLDGRTRYAKQLPLYNTDVLAELTY